MRRDIFRAGLITLWILLAAFIVVVVVPAPWDGTGGRDFRPQGALLAATLFVSGTAIRLRLRWSLGSLVGGLLLVELVALLVIGHFSGSSGTSLFIPFNLRSLAYVNLFIGAPWLAGVSLGSGIVWSQIRQASDA